MGFAEAPGVGERGRILEVAARAVGSGRAVAVADVLAAVGISTRAFYRHFESRDELLLAVFRREAEGRTARLAAAAAAEDPVAALRGWMVAFLDVPAEQAAVLRAEVVLRARGFAEESARVGQIETEQLLRVLRRGPFPRTVPEVDAPALRAVAAHALEERMRGRPAASVDDLVSFALRAVR